MPLHDDIAMTKFSKLSTKNAQLSGRHAVQLCYVAVDRFWRAADDGWQAQAVHQSRGVRARRAQPLPRHRAALHVPADPRWRWIRLERKRCQHEWHRNIAAVKWLVGMAASDWWLCGCVYRTFLVHKHRASTGIHSKDDANGLGLKGHILAWRQHICEMHVHVHVLPLHTLDCFGL